MAVGLAARVDSVSDALLEIIAFLHPAVDPDTGHHVCHHHGIGASVLRVGDKLVPVLVIGGCALVVEGRDYVKALLGEARESSVSRLGARGAEVDQSTVDPYWLVQALRVAAELNATASLYTIEIEGKVWAGVSIESRDYAALILVPPSCGEERVQRGSQSFYQ